MPPPAKITDFGVTVNDVKGLEPDEMLHSWRVDELVGRYARNADHYVVLPLVHAFHCVEQALQPWRH